MKLSVGCPKLSVGKQIQRGSGTRITTTQNVLTWQRHVSLIVAKAVMAAVMVATGDYVDFWIQATKRGTNTGNRPLGRKNN